MFAPFFGRFTTQASRLKHTQASSSLQRSLYYPRQLSVLPHGFPWGPSAEGLAWTAGACSLGISRTSAQRAESCFASRQNSGRFMLKRGAERRSALKYHLWQGVPILGGTGPENRLGALSFCARRRLPERTMRRSPGPIPSHCGTQRPTLPRRDATSGTSCRRYLCGSEISGFEVETIPKWKLQFCSTWTYVRTTPYVICVESPTSISALIRI